MKTIQTSIIIDSPIQNVWAILTNFSEYANWNPLIQTIEGTPIVGNKIKATLVLEGKKPMLFEPEILVFDSQKELRWLGHLFVKGLFDGEHYFEVKTLDDGKTMFKQGEKFTGLLSSAIYSLIGEKTKNGFISMNEALKQQAENNKA